MSMEYANALHAAGSSADGTLTWGAGATTSKTGAGDYNLTLDHGADATQCAILITPRTATVAFAQVVHTSDTVKQILLVDAAGAPVASSFDFLVIRAPK